MNSISTTSPALAVNPLPRPANHTRRSPDLVQKFRRSGQWHLIPLYHFLRLSDLAREGIEHSGSYRFADHLYRNIASGRGFVGRWLDRRVLNSRAACAMRQRCVQATHEISNALAQCPGPLRILAIPCGIPRDLLDAVASNPEAASRIEYTGMDLDSEVLQAAQINLHQTPLRSQRFIQGSALNASDFPAGKFDLILSTGLGEFLDDASLRLLYQNVFTKLAPGGVFYTSATSRERGSDYLLRAFELHTHYRTPQKIAGILCELSWASLELERDASGLQTFVHATH
jgi:hypothetical protein